MKIKILLTLLAILTTASGFAKIWQTNNTGVGPSDFTTLQDAHDGAVGGDTLYVVPSNTNYGTLTATKKLIIFGGGYFLGQNYPEYPTSLNSRTANIVLLSGSSGTVINGLYGTSPTYIYIGTSNITIQRTHEYYIALCYNGQSVSDILITQNYMTHVYNPGGGNCANVVIKNNYISTANSLLNNCQCVFENNVFFLGGTSNYSQQILINNINAGGIFSFSDCSLSNNIDASGTTSFVFGTTNGNKGGYTSAQVFVGPTGTSTDGQWKLKTGSPAIGAGIDGVDCGMFGGSTPYGLSGLPPIPFIKKLSTSGAGSNTTPIKVTTSVESKN
jgi:hypothetical protein